MLKKWFFLCFCGPPFCGARVRPNMLNIRLWRCSHLSRRKAQWKSAVSGPYVCFRGGKLQILEVHFLIWPASEHVLKFDWHVCRVVRGVGLLVYTRITHSSQCSNLYSSCSSAAGQRSRLLTRTSPSPVILISTSRCHWNCHYRTSDETMQSNFTSSYLLNVLRVQFVHKISEIYTYKTDLMNIKDIWAP